MRLEKFFALFSMLAAGLLSLAGCGGGYGGSSSQPPPTPPSSVGVNPTSASVAAGNGTQGFTASVGNDYLSRGVKWTLSGMGCSGATCGSLTAMSSSSVTYNAPAAVPNPATVILTATSINDSTKSASASITVTSAPAAATAASAVSFTITDNPPAGITPLSFEVSLTGAKLNPGSVDLLGGKGPIPIELRQLETKSAFLSTTSVAPGIFTSLSLTFADPELTFKNDAGMEIAGCAPGAVCEIKPTGVLTSTVNFPGSGIDIRANSPAGIQADVNVNAVLNAALGVDFSLPGAVSARELTMKPAGELDDLEDLEGAVQDLDLTNKQFTLHTSHGDFRVTADGTTEFDFETCAAKNLTCLQTDQVVEVDVKLMAGGAFVAQKIELEDGIEDDELEGIVVKIDDRSRFEMVVLDERRSVNNVSVGNPIVVALSNPEFQVKADGLSVPSMMRGNFESAVDTSQLLPGQTVEIRLTGPASPGPPVAVTANRVRLRMTQFTANVQAGSIASPDFSVDRLPALFTGASISDIRVQTSRDTGFEAVSEMSGLADGNIVSLRGILFNNGTLSPELVAKKVRKR